jgi:hypothetical protein
MALEIRKVRILSLSLDYNQVTWEVGDTSEDLLDYTFQVLRCESASGPFEPISKELEDTYLFIDNLVKVGNIYRQYHYTIRLKHKPSGELRDFGPYQKEPEPTLVADTLRMHLNLLMHEFIGRRCWLLPVRTFGQRCADCWNPRLQKRRFSGCRTCFDTGFVRGYHKPTEIWVSIDPAPANQQPASAGRMQQQSTTGRMSFYPPVKPDDVIVEPENIRWTVRTISTTQEQRAIVTQELALRRIETTDAEYLIPLDLGAPMEDLFYTPSRNYSNPHTLTNTNTDDLDYPLIYQMYPSFYPPVRT